MAKKISKKAPKRATKSVDDGTAVVASSSLKLVERRTGGKSRYFALLAKAAKLAVGNSLTVAPPKGTALKDHHRRIYISARRWCKANGVALVVQQTQDGKVAISRVGKK